MVAEDRSLSQISFLPVVASQTQAITVSFLTHCPCGPSPVVTVPPAFYPST
jgi:hypothetical protein